MVLIHLHKESNKTGDDVQKKDIKDQAIIKDGKEGEGAVVNDTSAGVTLNGAQVTAATGIVKAVEAGELPRDSGLAQLRILFNLTKAQAEEMMGSSGNNPPPKKDDEFSDQDEGKKKVLILSSREK